jgi:SAM-dependent methyltransferase
MAGPPSAPPSAKVSPSTRRGLSATRRIAEGWRLLQATRGRPPRDYEGVLAELATFDELLTRWTGTPLREARVFEVGFGARPYRLRALRAMGVDAMGVDVEVPLVRGRPGEFLAMWRRNGLERAAKSLARHVLADRRDERAFRSSLARRSLRAGEVEPGRLIVGDAAECRPPGSFDLVYSINVFEHVPRAALERLVASMAGWLRPDGLALVRPDIWTGLSGSHLLEWQLQGTFEDIPRRSEPWEHLRRRRFEANTTLNELRRDDYRDIFRRHFEILEELDPPRTGQDRFLTPEVRAELAGYSEQELLDNHPLFVLRPLGEQQARPR